jgi:hypothetical protein
MNLIFKKNTRRILNGTLFYKERGNCFYFEPQPRGGASILVNDVNLEIDEEGNVLYVWGLAAKIAWDDTDKSPPGFIQSGIGCILDKVMPGISIRRNKIGSWPMFFNKSINWFFIGEDINYKGFEYIEFAQNCVAILSDSGELKGLWLRPLIVP